MAEGDWLSTGRDWLAAYHKVAGISSDC